MTTGALEAFGPLLRRYRLAAGLSQEALAARAGLGVTTIAALERGRHVAPRPATVALLAEALGLDAERRAALAAAGDTMDRQGDAPGAAPRQPAASPSVAEIAEIEVEPGSSIPPAPPTALVGREREVAAVLNLLERPDVRVLTLTGPGGVGKTRLALAVLSMVGNAYPDGVAFVDLSALRDPALVAPTVARVLGLREEGSRSARDLLLARLRDKHMLLALDNFEQVTAAAPLVAELIAECASLTVLVTSRTPLRVRAEQQFRASPLPVPDPALDSILDQIAGSAAVRLFVARAREARPDFALSPANAVPVAEICRRLDGLPLAIELAAARTALLSPAALLARLDSASDQTPLCALGMGARDLPARQRTLGAAIDWSYHLLDPDAQRLFARLGVFEGGCTLETAEEVCNPDGALDVLDGVTSLVDASLLPRARAGETPRITMLQTLREYAREQLHAQGEMDALRKAHALHYTADVEASRTEFAAHQKAWLARWEPEHDNLRAALRWALECGEAGVGLRLSAVLWPFWLVRGYVSEGRRWLDDLLKQPATAPPVVRAEALRGATSLAIEQGDLSRADALCQEGLTLYRTIGETRGVADLLNLQGTIAREGGAFERAAACYEDSLSLCRGMDDAIGVAIALNNLGTTWRYQGALERAATFYEESLTLRRQSSDTRGIAYTLHNLGDVARDRGELTRAAAFYEESLALRRDLGDRQGVTRALIALGDVARERGYAGMAATRYAEGLALSDAVGDRWWMTFALQGLASVALMRGQARRAARLLRAIADLRAGIGAALPPAESAAYEAAVAAARVALGDGPFASAWAAGAMLSPQGAIAEAIEGVSTPTP